VASVSGVRFVSFIRPVVPGVVAAVLGGVAFCGDLGRRWVRCLGGKDRKTMDLPWIYDGFTMDLQHLPSISSVFDF